MRIATGLTAEGELNAAHFGESRYFKIYDVQSQELKEVEVRENPVPGHHIPGKGQRIMEILSDCDAIVVRSIGKGALTRMPQRGLDIYLTRAEDLNRLENSFREKGWPALKKLNPLTGKFEAPALV